ncbi:MAG TPA: hypothetical protein VI565_06885, partial [Burkholderiales bacterium]|nr:hypothetical protein [Burkholderiales bacterium]
MDEHLLTQTHEPPGLTFASLARALGLPQSKIADAFELVGGTPQDYYEYVIRGERADRVADLSHALGVANAGLSIALVDVGTQAPEPPNARASESDAGMARTLDFERTRRSQRHGPPEIQPRSPQTDAMRERPDENLDHAALAGKQMVRQASRVAEAFIDRVVETIERTPVAKVIAKNVGDRFDALSRETGVAATAIGEGSAQMSRSAADAGGAIARRVDGAIDQGASAVDGVVEAGASAAASAARKFEATLSVLLTML